MSPASTGSGPAGQASAPSRTRAAAAPRLPRFVHSAKDQRILKGRRHAVILKPSSAKVDDSELHLDELRELRAQLVANAALNGEDRARIRERLARLQQLLEAAGVPVPDKPPELLELEALEALEAAQVQQQAAPAQGQGPGGRAQQRGQAQAAGKRGGVLPKEASSARLG